MKNIAKKFILTLTILTLVFSVVPAYAKAVNSKWAQEAIDLATKCGIIPDEQIEGDYTEPICRIDIAQLVLNAYENIMGNEYEPKESPYADTISKAASAVFELGIMNGKGDGVFDSEGYTTREEMAKIILLFKSVAEQEELNLPSDFDETFTDFDKISEWAKPYVAKASAEKIINGYDDGSFAPKEKVSWEMAVSLITRTVKLGDKSEIEPAIPVISESEFEYEKTDLKISCEKPENEQIVKIKWDKISDADLYTVKVTEKRMPYYEEDIQPNETVTYEVKDNFLVFETVPNRKYVIEVYGEIQFDECEFITDAVFNDDAQEISENYPQTQEEAEVLMQTIEVPVWRLNGDEKISDTVSIIVHNKIAEKVKLVFEEIYNGEEKFPIKDFGGYSWRGGRSEHNGGTAIDINANENYCIYDNGTVIGSYWKPHEDPYSITPYGDVIRAFEKYGFTWGGDAWRNPKDYMHFSYLGT